MRACNREFLKVAAQLIVVHFFHFRSKVMAKNRFEKISHDADTEKVGFVSLILFRWMNIVFKTGNERALEETDFLPLAKENSSCFVTEQLETKWNEEQTKCKETGKRPKRWKSVMKMLSVKDVLVLITMGGLTTLCRIFDPLLLGYFMVSLLYAESHHSYLLYGCALAMFINNVIRCLCQHQLAYRGEVLSIRISSALKGLVYLKVSDNILYFDTMDRIKLALLSRSSGLF